MMHVDPLTVFPPLDPREGRIAALIAKWRARLNLTDWDIRFDPIGKIDVKGRVAEVLFDDTDKAAVIHLRSYVPIENEEALVLHEMLHVAMHRYAEQAERLLVHVRDQRARVHLNETLEEAGEEFIEATVRAFLPGTNRVLVMGNKTRERDWRVFQ